MEFPQTVTITPRNRSIVTKPAKNVTITHTQMKNITHQEHNPVKFTIFGR